MFKHRLLNLKWPYNFIIWIVAALFLIYIFSNHLDYTLFAYISYLFSTYALITFIIWFIKACKFSNNYVRENSKLYNFYNKHRVVVDKTFMILGIIINLFFGVIKLVSGIYYKSIWLIVFAIYYLLLCIMKFNILKVKFNDIKNKYLKLKHTGELLLLFDVILSIIIILILKTNKGFNYYGYLIYLVALYDFYSIIVAIVNIIKYYKVDDPLVISSKGVNLTVAMISMISLEVAMMQVFGKNEIVLKNYMTSILGLIVVLINSIMSISFIIRGIKNS